MAGRVRAAAQARMGAATVAGLALIVSAGLAAPRWMGEPPPRPTALDNAGGLHSSTASAQTDTPAGRPDRADQQRHGRLLPAAH